MKLKIKKEIIISLILVLLISTSLIGFITYSFMDTGNVLKIKNITPVYDHKDTLIVSTEENKVIFNDKNQKVEYKVLIENTANYAIAITNINLSQPSEDFLSYEIKGLKKDDILNANSTKEITVVLETVKKQGWGRNFDDDIITSIDYIKTTDVKDSEDNKPPLDIGNTNPPTVEIKPDVEQQPEELPEQDTNVDPGEEFIPEGDTNHIEEENNEETSDECDCKECNNKKYNTLIIVITIIYVILLIIVLLVFRKTMIGKILIVLLTLLPTIPLIKAEEIKTLSISIRASYESQNILRTYDAESAYWRYDIVETIKNVYIENEINEPANYFEKYDLSANGTKRVVGYLVENGIVNKYDWMGNVTQTTGYDLYIQADGVIVMNEDSNNYFSGLKGVETFNNMDGLDTRKVSNASSMFSNLGYYYPNFKLDLGEKFDTSNMTDMNYMFFNTGYNSTEFSLDLSNFDTSNVTNMSGMFMYTGYNSPILTIDVSGFDTNKVTNMDHMFYCTGYSNPEFTLDVSGFDTSNVETMSFTFTQTGANSSIFDLDLTNWNLDKVTTFNCFLQGAGRNSSKLNVELTITNPSVTSYWSMFSGTALNEENMIIVNYTNETSELVDDMIATATEGEIVFKGKNASSNNKVEIISGTGSNIGDEIKIANEHFYVISTYGNYTTLISKYNLEVGNECEVDLSYDKVSCVEIHNPSGIQNTKAKGALIDERFENVTEDYGAITFSSDNYWEIYYGSNYPRYVYDEQSDIQPHLSNYAIYLSNTGLTVLDARLISIEELIEFGCDVSSESCHASPYPWLYLTTYWTGSAANSSALYTIYNVGYVIAATHSINYGGGIRPVITIPTSEITK